MNNIVIPLKTQWMLSTTVRELGLEEVGDQLNVTFLGFYGNFLDSSEEKYKDIILTFSGVKDYRYFPDYSESDSDRLDKYDWEKIPEFRDESGSLAKHEDIFNKLWEETSICPNPSVYQVIESSWINEKYSGGPLKHYLILAGDFNLEVVAEKSSAD